LDIRPVPLFPSCSAHSAHGMAPYLDASRLLEMTKNVVLRFANQSHPRLQRTRNALRTSIWIFETSINPC
jgi:hypothetical protein